MGCCASRPGTSFTPPAVNAHSSSHNIITAPSTTPASIASPRASHASHITPHPSRSRQEPNDRPNEPLKPIPPLQRATLPNALASPSTAPSPSIPAAAAATGKSRARTPIQPLTSPSQPPWTRARLAKERTDWWDTQVTGRAEVWGAIRLAASYLVRGEVAAAQTMLDVCGCTCPSGLLWKGVYDATGVRYVVEEWVVVEVEGVAEDDGSGEVEGTRNGAGEEDGEGVLGDIVSIRARTSHNQKDVCIQLRQRESVASLIDKIRVKAKLNPSTPIRIAYGVRLYQPHETLETHPHWAFENDFVLSALVTQ